MSPHTAEWSPGDLFYRIRLKAKRSRGKLAGYYVYLPREIVREALGEDGPEVLWATRLVLQRGQKQVLIRLHREAAD